VRSGVDLPYFWLLSLVTAKDLSNFLSRSHNVRLGGDWKGL